MLFKYAKIAGKIIKIQRKIKRIRREFLNYFV